MVSEPGGRAALAALAFACAPLMGVGPFAPRCWPTANPRTAPTQTPMNTFQLLFTSRLPCLAGAERNAGGERKQSVAGWTKNLLRDLCIPERERTADRLTVRAP